jgi:Fur family transcriptional regulator, peroxide stress response regulator
MSLTREEIDARMAAFMEACRREGVKITHQRMEIFREVASTEEHPDAEQIFTHVRERIPFVSLDTVYRALALVEQLRLVSRVHVVSDRARFDANTHPHHHYICSRCGLIRDFCSEEVDNLKIPTEIKSWGTVVSQRLQVEGTCVNCASGHDPARSMTRRSSVSDKTE